MSFLRSINKKMPSDPNKNKKSSVRAVVLMGVFWRILIIEGILLIGTLIYAALIEDKVVTRLRITSISQKDRDILKRWISEAS